MKSGNRYNIFFKHIGTIVITRYIKIIIKLNKSRFRFYTPVPLFLPISVENAHRQCPCGFRTFKFQHTEVARLHQRALHAQGVGFCILHHPGSKRRHSQIIHHIAAGVRVLIQLCKMPITCYKNYVFNMLFFNAFEQVCPFFRKK